MKLKLLSAMALSSLMMAGAAFAMDSEMLNEKMAEIEERTAQASEEDRVAALEQQVEDLKELIHMMAEEDHSS
ncbi:hypothetical protein LCL99_02765 [Halomonas denitrificans]|uniref:hypothetical protein n=1 Tax=Halomonas TaxID=2745 RepID=UPI001A909994|nr:MULTISPECIES: hypothetical protein [Halomonas]MBN8414257.1 hypothetical protein [Halomonas litopenaei]MBY5930952.1 hypothetical protein [Halomonas sp. DP8Y7-3]MBY5968855.1 hypothetical protein [Halomonas denitrificans]MBY5984473.1 hypothetical protein [Halomonas sp. DP5Y7-2]MBY6029961.1 hypothetical protein [Halomonas sp. DP8Y7-1]